MLKGVKISIFKDGRLLKTNYSKVGGSDLQPDFGKYTFQFDKNGYHPETIKADLTAIQNPTGFTLNLKRRN